VLSGLVIALGRLVPPFGDETFMPTTPYLSGFTQAMRELWEEAVVGKSMEASPNAEH
jgi:hypothetical protein